MVELSVIIVSYNARGDLERCLASLHDPSPMVPHEIVVIDNQSSDASAKAARGWNLVHVIDAGANLGFAAACNLGIRAATGRNLLLLNSDTIVPSGAIDALIQLLRQHPDAAVVAPRLVDAEGRAELSFGRMISPLAEFRQKRLARGLDRGQPAAVERVIAMTRRQQWPDWVSGACLLVRRADAEAVALLDERYFMYLEDVDFCARIRARGRRVLFSPTVEVVHTRGRSAAAAPEATRAAYRRSQIAFYERHHPGWRLCSASIYGCGVSRSDRGRSPCYDRAVRIGIDARKLHDFGIGTYIRNLLQQLARLDQETEFVLICRGEDSTALTALGENFRAVPETSASYSVSEQLKIPIALRREGVTLFHAPHYVLPPLVRCPSIVTIHDCIHLMFPQYLPSRFALTYARASIGIAARRATRVLTVSDSSKRDILRHVDISPQKIDVIHNAYDERFGVEPAEEDVARVRERYQLHDQFVLYAGNVKPHKNLGRLIQAFHLVRQRGLDHLKLVMIGDEISRYAALRRAVHQHQLHKYVRFLGYLPQETLAVMYRLAGVFVFPSLYEGFGLPPLEAMASGAPVVTSNVSSLPEVTGDAALLVDPYDPEAIAEGIHRVLTDEALRRNLCSRGLRRARQFSWESSVRRVREIYQDPSRR